MDKITISQCHNFRDWIKFIEQGKNKKSRPIANNTSVYLWEGPNRYVGIKLHDTTIIKFYENGDIVLDSGGWKTPTTKERINTFAGGIRLWQEKKVWYVSWGKKSRPFADGITITKRGAIKNFGPNPEKSRKLDKQAVRYCRKFVDLFFDGKIEKPNSGDCWFCYLREEKSGRPMGELNHSDDHILSHIKEKYYVPSLLYNAITHRRAIMSTCSKDVVARIWWWEENKVEKFVYKSNDSWASIAKNQVYRSLLRYVRTSIGLAA